MVNNARRLDGGGCSPILGSGREKPVMESSWTLGWNFKSHFYPSIQSSRLAVHGIRPVSSIRLTRDFRPDTKVTGGLLLCLESGEWEMGEKYGARPCQVARKCGTVEPLSFEIKSNRWIPLNIFYTWIMTGYSNLSRKVLRNYYWPKLKLIFHRTFRLDSKIKLVNYSNL